MKTFRVGVLLVVAIAGAGRVQAGKPNVVFLLADDQRADTIAALGNPVIKTPNLDTLARSGFAFRNAYCMGSTQPSVCNPSRHMLLSGMSLYRYDPNRKEGTFGDLMRTAGYETWHVGKRGNTARVYHQAFHHSGYLDDQKERTSGHHGKEAIDRAIAFVKKGWDGKKPLFLYIAFEGPHDPRVASAKWMDLYQRDKIPLPANYKPFHPFDNGELLVRDELLAPWPRTQATVRKHLHDYYACISSIDYNIGRLLAALKERKEFSNTIFIFSSDHGLAIGSHGLFGKQSLYEHSMKSPLIFTGPGVPQGKSDALAYLFDVLPTTLDLIGAKTPAGLDGRSLAQVIAGKKDSVRDVVFLAYRNVQRAVRQGDWKLIRYPQVNVTQLFNLRDDPHELKNLAGDAVYAAKVREMMALLAAQQKHFGDKAPLTVEKPRPAAVDEKFFAAAARLSLPQPRLPRDKLLVYRSQDGTFIGVKTVEDWGKRRAEVVRGMEFVMGKLPGKEKRCALDMKVEAEVDCGTYLRRLVTYASEPGSRVPAYLLVPKAVLKGKKKVPAILCLHPTDNVIGHGTVVGLGKRPNRAYAMELAKRGYVTLAPSYPLLAKYQPNLKKLGWESGTLKAVWDNMRGLDLLESLPFVDGSRMGAIGHSLGGHNSVYTAVFDGRLKVVVSSCGLDSYLDFYKGDEKNWQPERGWCQTRYMLKLADYKGRLADIPFDFHEMIGALAPRHVLIIAPTKDSNFRADSVDRIAAAARPVFKLYGHEDRLKVEHPDCDHDFLEQMRETAYKLFDKVLALDDGAALPQAKKRQKGEY